MYCTLKRIAVLTTMFTILSVSASPYTRYDYSSDRVYTRNITLRQGTLKGVVIGLDGKRKLPPVEVYLGIPYAAPPVGELRFMPTGGTAPSWFGIKYADTFGPVCPQKFPDEKKMPQFRRQYFLRLKEYLKNESEDCLYLNIYAPYKGKENSTRKYPVMVYIHGESFEWNSGNPYDGSVLAGYGKVIVVTINFRLGILGFLKIGLYGPSSSNFGLLDQIAALLWVKDNIGAFDGDPNSITLFGHGTGAVCASLLTLSLMSVQNRQNTENKENRENSDGEELLFHRAILMSGTALADWALAGNPTVIMHQVSREVNCPILDDFATCLRRKRLKDIMNADARARPYETVYGPIVDDLVVANEPEKLMTQYTSIFERYELMYGVTELESIHLLNEVALVHGMLEKERDEELKNYVRFRCEMKPELCFMHTLKEYTASNFTINDREYKDYTGQEPSKALLARDALLDILSDARYVAPIVRMAKYHSALNEQSYFYVFSHKTHSKDYIRKKSFNGEELPYVFGVPLGGPKFHFVDSYTDSERLFSELVMTYFCNFAYTGNPNYPRKNEFLTMGPATWTQYVKDWPEFDLIEEKYLELDIPPQASAKYRNRKTMYWNKVFPTIPENLTVTTNPPYYPSSVHYGNPAKASPPFWILEHLRNKTTFSDKFRNEEKSKPKTANVLFGTVYDKPQKTTDIQETEKGNTVYGTVLNTTPEEVKQDTSPNLVIVAGGLFLLANVILLFVIYFKCIRNKKNNLSAEETGETSQEEMGNKEGEAFLVNGCNIVKMMSKSSKGTDYGAVKMNNGVTNYNLTRQMSNSTIDAHTKVRDWITQEIVYKYSPRFLRRPRTNQTKTKIPVLSDTFVSTDTGNDSTLGRSPTRPVSPVEGKVFQQTIMKTSTITRPKIGKPAKVSVGIDATPTGRGDSILMQQPIEMTKSLEYPHLQPNTEIPLRRSITLEDFSPRVVDNSKDIRRSTASINLKYPETQPTVIKIEHGYSKSEPVEDLNYVQMRKMKTFDPKGDVNVTSRDDYQNISTPLTPEESLRTIKRRNFPKVLPDHPGKEALMHKRRSMPAHGLFLPIPESSSFSQPNSPINKSFTKLPPIPPPRTTTLSKQSSAPSVVCVVPEPILIQQPPSPEPEVVCNNLYVGPLIPKTKIDVKNNEISSQPIYDSLNCKVQNDFVNKSPEPKTIVTADPNMPIKRPEPKVVVRPTNKRNVDDKHNKHIPRVVVPDNQPETYKVAKAERGNQSIDEERTKNSFDILESESNPTDGTDSLNNKKNKKSQIPTPVKSSGSNKESSSSESTSPSEESDTGTVVKKI